MLKVTVEGVGTWWDYECPNCRKHMSFRDGAELALCSWCVRWWRVDWSLRDAPKLEVYRNDTPKP